ncbi:hypothetical protein BDW69DRAFT_180058 [Aspergillus filifer]
MSKLLHSIRRRSSSFRPAPATPRHLYVVSDTTTFDSSSLGRLEAEGFSVEYISFKGRRNSNDENENGSGDINRDRKELEKIIHEREDDLEPGERYAVVAYNRPAYLLLLSHHQPTSTNPFPRLCAFVAFYPDAGETDEKASPLRLPPSTTAASTAPSAAFETASTLAIQIHLAGSQDQRFALWDDSNKRHKCHVLFYPESRPGFAESTSAPNYDRISSRLAWSRSLDCLKRGFGWPAGGGDWGAPEPESVWEGYWRNVYESATSSYEVPDRGRAPDMLGLMVGGGMGDSRLDDATRVTCVPSGVGGSSPREITSFYASEFLPAGPPSQHIRLLSRTTNANRVVDELLLTFEHTEEIPWLLPNVPPTGKSVRVPLVMTASFLGGKMARHNIYWDQASVLVQVGLLDPALIPSGFKTTGPNRRGKDTVERIPVVGGEAVDSVIN